MSITFQYNSLASKIKQHKVSQLSFNTISFYTSFFAHVCRKKCLKYLFEFNFFFSGNTFSKRISTTVATSEPVITHAESLLDNMDVT